MSQITNVMYFLAGYIKESYDEIYKPLHQWLNAIVEENADFEGGRAYFVNDNVYDIGYDFKYNFEELMFGILQGQYFFRYIKHHKQHFDRIRYKDVVTPWDLYNVVRADERVAHSYDIITTVILWQILHGVYNLTYTIPYDCCAYKHKLVSVDDDFSLRELLSHMRNKDHAFMQSVIYNIKTHNLYCIYNYAELILDVNAVRKLCEECEVTDVWEMMFWMINLDYNTKFTTNSIVNNMLIYAKENAVGDVWDMFCVKTTELPRKIEHLYIYLLNNFEHKRKKHILAIFAMMLYAEIHNGGIDGLIEDEEDEDESECEEEDA